jgi:hypothetical protein
MDADCRRVNLDSGSYGCQFLIKPRFKAQQDGSTLYYGYSFKLETKHIERHFLHVSPKSFYSEINDPNNADLHRVLRTGKQCELNAAAAYTTFQATKFAKNEDPGLMLTGTPFRLYHSQAESFLQASCDPDKGKYTERERPNGGDVLPGHIPYLKQMKDTGSDPDPTNPANQSSKGVWVFESLNRSMGDNIEWNKPIRIRHYPSGKYLAVDITDPTTLGTSDWYETYLMDDASTEFEERDESIWDLCQMKNMVFYIASTELTNTNAMPSTAWSVRVEHRMSLGGGPDQTLYFSTVR